MSRQPTMQLENGFLKRRTAGIFAVVFVMMLASTAIGESHLEFRKYEDVSGLKKGWKGAMIN